MSDMLTFSQYQQSIHEARTIDRIAKHRDTLAAAGAGALALATGAHHLTTPAPTPQDARQAQTEMDRSQRNRAQHTRHQLGLGQPWQDLSLRQKLSRAHMYGDAVVRPLLYAGLIATAGLGTNQPRRRRNNKAPIDESQSLQGVDQTARQAYRRSRKTERGSRGFNRLADVAQQLYPHNNPKLSQVQNLRGRMARFVQLDSPDYQLLMLPTLDPKLAQRRRESKIPQSPMLLTRTSQRRESTAAAAHPTRTRQWRGHKKEGTQPQPFG